MSAHFHLICTVSTNSVCTLSATAKWTAYDCIHTNKCQVIQWSSRMMILSASVTSEIDRHILVTGRDTVWTSTLPYLWRNNYTADPKSYERIWELLSSTVTGIPLLYYILSEQTVPTCMLQFNDNLTTVSKCCTVERNDSKLKLTYAALTGTWSP